MALDAVMPPHFKIKSVQSLRNLNNHIQMGAVCISLFITDLFSVPGFFVLSQVSNTPPKKSRSSMFKVKIYDPCCLNEKSDYSSAVPANLQ